MVHGCIATVATRHAEAATDLRVEGRRVAPTIRRPSSPPEVTPRKRAHFTGWPQEDAVMGRPLRSLRRPVALPIGSLRDMARLMIRQGTLRHTAMAILSLSMACGTAPSSQPTDAGSNRSLSGSDAAAPPLFGSEGGCAPSCGAVGTVKGTVYDPAGLHGLYNVYVYVPSAPLDPIASGPTCSPCGAVASGKPVASTSTAAEGTFSLSNVPVGADVPIVLQLGKWRRHLTLPNVVANTDNEYSDGFFRLPRKQYESSPDDNIPRIAFTTGCDGVECFFLNRIGIDQSEFSAPGGSGRVHVYKSSHDDGQTFAGGAGSAEELWANSSELMTYDILFDACECDTYDRGGGSQAQGVGYVNFLNYVNAGGRAFSTHYFYNFFANSTQCDPLSTGNYSYCDGQGVLPSVAAWKGNHGLGFVDTPPPQCPRGATLPAGDLVPQHRHVDPQRASNGLLVQEVQQRLGGGRRRRLRLRRFDRRRSGRRSTRSLTRCGRHGHALALRRRHDEHL